MPAQWGDCHKKQISEGHKALRLENLTSNRYRREAANAQNGILSPSLTSEGDCRAIDYHALSAAKESTNSNSYLAYVERKRSTRDAMRVNKSLEDGRTN